MYQNKILTLLLVLWSINGMSQFGSEEKYERTLEKTGDILHLGIPAAALTISIIKKDWEGTKQHALSYGTNVAVTHALKYLIDKKRPEGSSKDNAFPSGHTSKAFQGASFIQRRYGWKYGKYAYVLAAIVGYTRIEGLNDRHDLLDVLGGAAVGIGSTYIFTKPLDRKEIKVSFSSFREYKMISLSWNF